MQEVLRACRNESLISAGDQNVRINARDERPVVSKHRRQASRETFVHIRSRCWRRSHSCLLARSK
jgi:hypothetical protein